MPEPYLQTLKLGEAQITIMTLALLRWDFATQMSAPTKMQLKHYAHLFKQPGEIPIRCMHIQAPGISLLVDASIPEAVRGTQYELPSAPTYPNLLDQLALVGISPRDITHVVITHHHFDHIIGLTMRQEDILVPCFPQARHYLGRADWEDPDVQNGLPQPDSLFNQTLGVLEHLKLLELVDGDRELGHGLSILHMPGETPGHQILRFSVGGQTLYYLGDLYHHQVEMEQPTWMTPWSDSSTLLRSRQRFSQMALTEDAMLVATHIPDIGRIHTTPEGEIRWEVCNP